MKPDATESRIKRLVDGVREYVTHSAIGGAAVALTGFAPEHWFADLYSHLSIPEGIRHGWLQSLDIRIGLVAIGVAMIGWDVLRRSRAQPISGPLDRRAEMQPDLVGGPDRTSVAAATATGGKAATSKTPQLALPDMPSIAVLPFTNMSGDPEQEYFADGMVDDILTALARMGNVFVIARNSSFVYKGRAVDIKQVGRELGVRYVLEGSVRRAGNQLRITGQLIEAESGRHIWADRFEGAVDDVFELQDRISESVVYAIEPGVRRAELERVRRKPTDNLQAYDYLIQAIPGLMPGTGRDEKDASSSFIRRALEMDPGFSLAKAMAAFACMQRVFDGYGEADDVKSGLRFAEEALADHQDNPMILSMAGLALATLGFRVKGLRVLGFRYDEARRAIDRALSLSPNMFVVRLAAGLVRAVVGEGDAAIEHFERAMRLSPLDPGIGALINSVGAAHLACGRYEDALAAAQRAIEVDPKFASAHRLMAITLGYLGRSEEATLAAQRMLELVPDFTVSRYSNVSPVKDTNLRKRCAELLRAAGVPN